MFRFRLAVAIVAATLASGCAATRSAPPVFGPVESTGMVVLVCRVETEIRDRLLTDELTVGSFGFDQPQPIDAATLVNLDDPTVNINGRVLGSVIVFPSLAPGSYFIRSVLMERDFLERVGDVTVYRDRTIYRFEPALTPEFLLTVTAGEIAYIGRLTIRGGFVGVESEGLRSTTQEPRVLLLQPQGDPKGYRIDRDESDEWMNWSRLLRTYKETPWAARIESRLAALTPPAHP